jgi:small Trp-rich protein
MVDADESPLQSSQAVERVNIMPLILVIIGLSILRYFEVGPFAELSWWWIVALFGVAFVWFEFVERMFGLDKRKAHEQLEKARAERVKNAFKK